MLISCSDTSTNSSDKILFNLDSTTFMYCKINTSLFYGKYFSTKYLEPIPINNNKVVSAHFIPQDIILSLKNGMTLDNEFSEPLAEMKIDTSFYSLSAFEPYNLNLTSFTDSLITGTFYGVFINNSNIKDTVNVTDGYFEIFPYIYFNFLMKAKFNGEEYQTTFGIEQFIRKTQFISALDTNYQDSLSARILIDATTLTNSFVKKYYFYRNHKYLRFTFEIYTENEILKDTYHGFEGYVSVNEMEDYQLQNGEEQRVSNLNFDVSVQNNDGEIINITDGHFSSSGF